MTSSLAADLDAQIATAKATAKVANLRVRALEEQRRRIAAEAENERLHAELAALKAARANTDLDKLAAENRELREELVGLRAESEVTEKHIERLKARAAQQNGKAATTASAVRAPIGRGITSTVLTPSDTGQPNSADRQRSGKSGSLEEQ